jgi:hypothetical protein
MKVTAAAVAGAGLGRAAAFAQDSPAEKRAPQDPGVTVLNPRNRVPLSFIIDDSTCLVNMGCFCMPQFAEAWPDRPIYKRPWKTWPREIPDAFVREFGEWCAEHGVKGKYSVVPYPACVGWLDRELPGWSRRELTDSLQLVRDLMVPHWDIHPEMITHTRVIDIKTGRPMQEISPATMENSYPQTKKSVDELAAYLAYALRILKNCELPCEGITTPGGFGNSVESELSLAVQQAVRDVYGVELPHYFKYVSEGTESAEPKMEHVNLKDANDPRVTVNVPAGTGDWYGGWDGDEKSQGHLYANEDATSGRMVELIERGEPAIMLCHWAGMYTHGTKQGFADLKKVVVALNERFAEQTMWMKVSEIARYWAVKELTTIQSRAGRVTFQAPFGGPNFTVGLKLRAETDPKWSAAGRPVTLRQVSSAPQLSSGTWLRDKDGIVACFDLPKGESVLQV